MKNDAETLDAVLAGFYGYGCTGMWSSANWLAYQAGVNMRGTPRPQKARMSRGYSVRVVNADGESRVTFSGDKLERCEMTLQAEG